MDPSPELIEEAIDSLLPVLYYFVIIEPGEPVDGDGCKFIQTAISQRDDTPILNYIVEAEFANGEPFTHYGTLMTDANEVKRLFRMFVLGIPMLAVGKILRRGLWRKLQRKKIKSNTRARSRAERSYYG